MDYFVRISEQQAYLLSNEYRKKYETYNCISSQLDSIESQSGGLYPVEVWFEVLRLEKLLLTANRRDKFIAEQRTRLENKYRKIIIGKDVKAIERSKDDAERSVMCVLLALAMHLEACPDDKENPHKAILKSIYKMVVEYNPELACAIGEKYNEGEDEEMDAGYIVQPHDPLVEEEKVPLTLEQNRAKIKTEEIFDFFASVLSGAENCVDPRYTKEEFYEVWEDIANEKCIIEQMMIISKRLNPDIKEDITIPGVENVKRKDYNLKLVLNIIGMMRESIITFSIDAINALFFTKTKAKYLRLDTIKNFGTVDSGIADEPTYNIIYKIIEKHKK